jgi:hypothetical protein
MVNEECLSFNQGEHIMKDYRKLLTIIPILLISTLACSLTGITNPVSSLQTLIPDEAQTMVAAQAQTLVATVIPSSGTEPAGSGGVTSVSEGCENPLYPVVAGATWSYAITSILPDTYTRSIPLLLADGFADHDVFASGVTRTGQWSCEAGNLTALDPGGNGIDVSGSVQADGVDADFTTLTREGVTIPAVITSGTNWSQLISLDGTQNIGGTDVASKSITTFTCTAGGDEPVTVPAGAFTAMRVECQTKIKIIITMAGLEIPTEVNFSSTTWYAPGVGMVKSDSILSDGSHALTELTAYNIP